MSDAELTIDLIRKEIEAYRLAEAEARAKRLAMEELLRKLEHGERNRSNRARGKRLTIAELADAAEEVLADGQPRALKDILVLLERKTGTKIPESSLRTALADEERFHRVDRGVYALRQEAMTLTGDDVPF